MKTFLQFLFAIALSVLVFFSVSFFSVLHSIWHPPAWSELTIGFPFTYYHQFWLRGNSYPNCEGNVMYLLTDALLCWMMVMVLWWFLRVIRNGAGSKRAAVVFNHGDTVARSSLYDFSRSKERL